MKNGPKDDGDHHHYYHHTEMMSLNCDHQQADCSPHERVEPRWNDIDNENS
jgi:hypothetical protein